ncbi:hypothetical protein L209DRAFT_596420 [Thermothelomyces heterothallicus CBS 203.75]
MAYQVACACACAWADMCCSSPCLRRVCLEALMTTPLCELLAFGRSFSYQVDLRTLEPSKADRKKKKKRKNSF